MKIYMVLASIGEQHIVSERLGISSIQILEKIAQFSYCCRDNMDSTMEIMELVEKYYFLNNDLIRFQNIHNNKNLR